MSGRRHLGGDLDRHLIEDLQCPEQRRVGLDAPLALLDDRVPREGAIGADRELELERQAPAREVELTADLEVFCVGGVDRARAEFDLCALSTSSLIVWAIPALSLSPSAITPPVPSRIFIVVESAVSSIDAGR